MTMKPNFKDLGDSFTMSPSLRNILEEHLRDDLKNYGIISDDLKFDWSVSCAEGHQALHPHGTVENYSGIGVYHNDKFIGEGWMDLISDQTGNFILAYWQFIETYDEGKLIAEKSKVGIPDHIWEKLSNDLKQYWKDFKIRRIISP